MKTKSIFLLAVLLAANAAHAETCSCEVTDRENQTLIVTETRDGEQLKGLFPARPINRSVRQMYLCTETSRTVTEARLWMPDMGHGSTPTRLTAMTPTCTKVDRVNFVMSGAWDIQVSFRNGDRGTLSFEVVR